MRDAGMGVICEICEKDEQYLNVIRESSIVKNLVKLLDGRGRGRERGKEGKEMEG